MVSVYFFAPNIIGYIRIVLTCVSFYYAFTDWKITVVTYAASFICDFWDGYFARWFDQSSNYGAVLDMVTDRCSTAGLLFLLSHLYDRKWSLGFMAILLLDFASHWYHMYASKGHHKSVDTKHNIILRTYYGVYPFFGYCCVGTEFFYILLYVLAFKEVDPSIPAWVDTLTWYVTMPAAVMKNIINVAQLADAAATVAEDDQATRDKRSKKAK